MSRANGSNFHARGRFLKSVLMVSSAFILPGTVLAQAGPADNADEASDIIVVTATKRAADIQDIAASISQIGGDDLEMRGIGDIENLSAQIPNLTFGKFGVNSFITLRGIGTTVDSGVAEPSVATYVDGIFLPRSTMGVLRQIDLERVEVLRGPQGTLYGRNATGGAINFVPRAPSRSFEGGFRVFGESRNGYGGSAYLSGPLGENVAVRVSGGFEKQDGYVEVLNTGQDLGETDIHFGRLAVRIEPSSNLTVDMAVQFEKSDGDVGWQSISTAPVNVLGLVQLLNAPPTSAGLPVPNFSTVPNTVFNDGRNSASNRTTIASMKLNWDISDEVSIRSTTGYVDHDVSTYFDADGTDFFFADLVDSTRPSESFSQELMFYGENQWLSWLVGGFYYEEDFGLTLPVDFNAAALGIGPPNVRVPVLAGDLREETTSYALFTDLEVSITESLKLLAGARLNWEEKNFTFFGAPSPAGKIDTSDFLPKLGLQYEIDNDVNFYVQWQKGVKSGGHQLAAPDLFAPEELNSFEGGIKSRWLDGMVTFNASAFFYDYKDLQATITIPPTTTQIESGDAEIFGLEAELFVVPAENIKLNFGASFLDSEYTDLTSADQTVPGSPNVDLSGAELIRAPKVTFNAGAEWNIPVQSELLGNITFRGDLFYSDSFKLTFFAYPETTQSAYATANLSVTLTDSSDRFQLRAYVNNVTDKIILNNASFLATSGSFIAIHSEPRHGGVSFSARF
ncbi:TonB-dependent receptor [uncultured Parasphingorhabdus sp.]|uniref:TonB-dependent receptor n=1 Tax=uncultured Parasphingorhabdus sp. TaxID=2709694 RepID=UPI002AA9254A|nr:TonB-dependent receptor [uncultured Parasphingorhabdus sp.]